MLKGIFCFLLIALAALGLALLMQTVAKHFLYPFKKRRCIVTVIPFSADTADMETSVRFFSKYSDSGFCHSVVILDCGLDGTGRTYADLVARQNPNVVVCSAGDLFETVEKLYNAASENDEQSAE